MEDQGMRGGQTDHPRIQWHPPTRLSAARLRHDKKLLDLELFKPFAAGTGQGEPGSGLPASLRGARPLDGPEGGAKHPSRLH